MAGDVNYLNVSLLLHCNGTNGSTTFTDNSSLPKAPTVSGNTQISTTQSKFGGASAYFDGTGDYLTYASSSAFDWTGDATIECWFYANSLASGVYSLFGNHSAANDGKFQCYVYSTGKIAIGKIGSSELASATGLVSTSTWYHIAVVKNGSTVTIYLNGVNVASGTAGTYVTTGTDVFNVGYFHGTNGNTWNGYIDEVRVTNGIARYTSDFTPPTSEFPNVLPDSDAYYLNSSLLLHCNGTNGSTTFTDNSPLNRTVTPTTATISTAQSKFGGASCYVTGGGYLTSPISLNTVNDIYTLEAWVYTTDANNFFLFTSGGFYVELYTGLLYIGNSGANVISGVSGHGWTANAWNHIALVNDGTSFLVFINGLLKASTTSRGTNMALTSIVIGARPDQSTYSSGYIDEIRVTKGIARYSVDFTPPTSPFPDTDSPDAYASNVSLLLNCNGTNGSTTFTDSSSSPKTVTPSGNAQISTAQSKYGGASSYFDGTGDYLTSASDAAWSFSSDFTIEMWIYPETSWLTDAVLLSTNVTNGITIGLANSSPFGVAAHNTAWLVQGTNPTVNTWSHIAVVRRGAVVSIYVNGVSIGTPATYATTFAQGVLSIGALSDGSRPFRGYIDDIRITSGIARYTADFTPPISEFSLNISQNVSISGSSTVIVSPLASYLHKVINRNLSGSSNISIVPAASYMRKTLHLTISGDINYTLVPTASTSKTPLHYYSTGDITISVNPVSQMRLALKYGISGNSSIVISPFSLKLRRMYNTIQETVNSLDSLSVYEILFNYINEIIDSISTSSSTIETSDYISDIINCIDLINLEFSSDINENISITPALVEFVDNIEILSSLISLSSSTQTKVEFIESLIDLLKILESLDYGNSEIINENISSSDIIEAVSRAINSLVESLTLDSVVTNSYVNIIGLSELLTAVDTNSTLSNLIESINEDFIISISSGKGQDNYLAYLLSPETMSVSNYNNYNFDGATKFSGRYIFYNSSGLFEYGGDRDNGEVYSSSIETIAFNFGNSNIKQVPAIYLGATSSGPWYLKVKTDGKKECYYKLNKHTDNLHTQKIAIGKGLLSRYFQFEMVTDADTFNVESIDFYPIELRRKL